MASKKWVFTAARKAALKKAQKVAAQMNRKGGKIAGSKAGEVAKIARKKATPTRSAKLRQLAAKDKELTGDIRRYETIMKATNSPAEFRRAKRSAESAARARKALLKQY